MIYSSKRMLVLGLALVGLFAAGSLSPAEARGHHRHRHHSASHAHRHHAGHARTHQRHVRHGHSAHHRRVAVTSGGDPRPSAWCGWQMRQWLGVRDRLYNLARAWASYGSHAAGPSPGVIVVWPHHVGIITGGSPGHWVVRSGNDGHTIRERERSLRGVIAYRTASGWSG